jgi:hypothetical protein
MKKNIEYHGKYISAEAEIYFEKKSAKIPRTNHITHEESIYINTWYEIHIVYIGKNLDKIDTVFESEVSEHNLIQALKNAEKEVVRALKKICDFKPKQYLSTNEQLTQLGYT